MVKTAGVSRWLRRPPKDVPDSAMALVYQAAQKGARRSITASAMPLEGPAGRQAWNARGGSAWQKDAWYHFDACGEARSAVMWIANAVSRAALYAAETDPETGQITGPTDDARAQAVASAMLGGYEERPQLQSTMALHWQVPGETFVLIQPQGGSESDRWLVLSDNEVSNTGGTWSFTDPLTGVITKTRPGTDKLIRVWSPHPLQQTHADSAFRAALPILREIEKTSQNIAARLDSRIAGNGMLFIPQEIDFPRGENEPADALNFARMLMDAAEASLQNPGTAAAQVPLVAQVPAELIGNFQWLDFASKLDDQIMDMRGDAMQRLGRTLDMPKDIALGEMGDANHWSAWQIEETTYKIHVEPFLVKLAAALTKEYYRPALKAMGVEDPSRFVLAWDISEVTSRPDRSDDMRDLHDRGLISDNYMRAQFGIPDDAIPTEQEAREQLAVRLVTNAPTTLENPSVAAAVGFEPTANPDAPAITPSTPTPPAESRALPNRPSEPEAEEGLVAAAELVVFDALSRAGGRLLTRQYRGQFASTPKTELHTVIPHSADDMPRLMEGSFQFTERVAHAFAINPILFENALRAYVENRVQQQLPHDRETLRRFL